MYVGISKNHAGNVPLVLNFETGNITAQWNVVFDDWFTTVATNVDDLPDLTAKEWSEMFGTNTYDSTPHDEIEEFAPKVGSSPSNEVEDYTPDEEEALRQLMLQPPEHVQPDRTRSYSQVTATPPGRDDDRRSNNMSTKSTNIQSTSSSNLKTPVEQTQITPMNKLDPPPECVLLYSTYMTTTMLCT